MVFEQAFLSLESLGLTNVLLPFFLVFVVGYAALNFVPVFKKNKKFTLLIALILAFGVVIPHLTGTYPPGLDVVDIINSGLPIISLIAIAVIMALMLIGIFGEWRIPGWFKGLAVIASFALVIWIFGANFFNQTFPYGLGFLDNPDLQMLIVIILVFALIIWFVMGGEEEEGGTNGRRERGIVKGAQNFLEALGGQNPPQTL